ncbi:hypothetical protein ZWY2020_043561 [Hordeum vulgare]|nr:hypothetical protein ZWY2020_043561 [Hordeum vulgare]
MMELRGVAARRTYTARRRRNCVARWRGGTERCQRKMEGDCGFGRANVKGVTVNFLFENLSVDAEYFAYRLAARNGQGYMNMSGLFRDQEPLTVAGARNRGRQPHGATGRKILPRRDKMVPDLISDLTSCGAAA